jgi:hypothetical protein
MTIKQRLRRYLKEIGRGGSRLLNAMFGGPGDVTFSAWSWELVLRGSAWGRWRVRVLDAISGENHCYDAWIWHRTRGLIVR